MPSAPSVTNTDCLTSVKASLTIFWILLLGSIWFLVILLLPIPWPEIDRVSKGLAMIAAMIMILGAGARLSGADTPPGLARALTITGGAACTALFAVPLAVTWYNGTFA